MLVAIDNFGEIYMALSQVNTNNDMFQLFMTQLAAKLERESPGSMGSTYWIIDGASYHRSPSTLSWMTSLGLKVLIAAPYGFQAMPVEMVFAFLKQADINPEWLATGKTSKWYM